MQDLRRRILVVDDQASIREFLATSLADAGYAVQAVSSGQEMRRVLGTRAFDLVIVDAVLPDERGLDLVNFLIGRGIRALMITGDRFNMTGVVGLTTPILQKPFRGAELVERVRSCLAQPPAARHSSGSGARPLGRRGG
jgi:DNA-binding response OmpR family regulator